MNIIGIIPARYASTRFPAKALADIGGKSMVRRVYEQALKSERLDAVVVATDDPRIYDHVHGFGGNVVMTSPHHQSGTDRCAEVVLGELIFSEYGITIAEPSDYVINIQGDEPFIQPQQIDTLVSCLDGLVELATLAKKIGDTTTLFNPNTPKVVLNARHEAIYFSRQAVPFLRDAAPHDWLAQHDFYKHIGIYAYRVDVLRQITQLPVSILEKAEALEQLRWIENGFKVKVALTQYDSHGIDTPADLVAVQERFL